MLLLFTILASASDALALPKVGDQAIYDVTVTEQGKRSAYTSVVEIVAFNAVNDTYLQRDTKKVDGQPDQIQEDWKEPAEIMSDDKVENILADCDQVGGVTAGVAVPAGNFTSCSLPVSADETQPFAGRVWIARVRFGLARSELTAKGVTTVTSLRSFR